MNALIYATVLAGSTGMSIDVVAVVWLFVLVVEWLADRFAGWLWHRWSAHWSPVRMGILVHDIAARSARSG